MNPRSLNVVEAVGSVVLQGFDILFPREAPAPLTALPPPSVSRPPTPPEGFFIGTCHESGTPLYITLAELDRHVLMLGSTGTGKTTSILRLFDEEVSKWR